MRIRVSSFVVTALLAATAHPAAAQDWALGRGSIAVGGSASFTSTGGEVNGNESDDRLTTIALAPSLQFFLTERFSFGGSLSFAYASEGDDSITTWGIGPAATYYFGEHGRSTHPYLGAGVDFSRQSDDSSEDRDRTGFRGPPVGGHRHPRRIVLSVDELRSGQRGYRHEHRRLGRRIQRVPLLKARNGCRTPGRAAASSEMAHGTAIRARMSRQPSAA